MQSCIHPTSTRKVQSLCSGGKRGTFIHQKEIFSRWIHHKKNNQNTNNNNKESRRTKSRRILDRAFST